MDEGSQRTGLVVSGAMHLALLAVLVLGFSQAPKFDDATESIAVETVTTTELNQIMQGEKTGKPAPAPQKAATEPPPSPTPTEPPPEPPKRPEPADSQPPPEPPKRPEPAKPEPPVPEPPKRPEPPKPEPPKPQTEAPTPPVKPHIAQKLEDPPRPPEKPRVSPKPEETPKPPDKFKPDEIAKALAKEKSEEKPRPKPPSFDPSAINKLIGQTKTADASAHAATPQGLPNRSAARMSVSLENALNEWFRDSYKNCWNLPPSNPTGDNYVFDVRVTFNPDGSLAGRPVLLNPPHDPEWRAHADSVMRAVMRCNPLHIPAQYAPYFDQWRSKTIHFDPASAEG